MPSLLGNLLKDRWPWSERSLEAQVDKRGQLPLGAYSASGTILRALSHQLLESPDSIC